jgi:hypothetical protein
MKKKELKQELEMTRKALEDTAIRCRVFYKMIVREQCPPRDMEEATYVHEEGMRDSIETSMWSGTTTSHGGISENKD